ncbi:MAG: hypothetical protein KTR31_06670 [Myxococcales bacterium]|nr:hypothetical protein [Myxococcales bacterium]
MTPLFERTWSTADLLGRHPLQWDHPNKSTVFDIGARDPDPTDVIRVCRYRPTAPRAIEDPRTLRVVAQPGAFTYDDVDEPHVSVFYPNFADPDLFGYWDGPLLAQDELQVAEHPALAAVRQQLLAEGLSTATLDTDGRPTPFTVQGARRRVAIDVAPAPDRPWGLYGNRFARADVDTVRAATTRLEPAPRVNLVALTAPVGGHGRYTTLQIHWILTAAHTAFAAAVCCSDGSPTRLHTGFWGCGAFGGNRVLMALLQLVAAAAAGVSEVVFHPFDADGEHDLRTARRHLDQLAATLSDEPSRWVTAVDGLGLTWGVSDGN